MTQHLQSVAAKRLGEDAADKVSPLRQCLVAQPAAEVGVRRQCFAVDVARQPGPKPHRRDGCRGPDEDRTGAEAKDALGFCAGSGGVRRPCGSRDSDRGRARGSRQIDGESHHQRGHKTARRDLPPPHST
jgi:hypothetical protein